MRNIKLTIQYDGTAYAGWQFQKNARSVQEVIQAAIKKVTGQRVTLVGSGRTDSGVHALAQIANFKTVSSISPDRLQMALNASLPKDIAITKVEEVAIKFDAQKSARSKLYRYTVFNNNYMSPFLKRYTAKCFHELDISKMRRAAKLLMGKHDFNAFRAQDGIEKDSVRTVKSIRITATGNVIYIDIEADGFLYNMVRNIVGTLVEYGRGKFELERVKSLIARGDRRLSGPTMPAKGLCLVRVRY